MEFGKRRQDESLQGMKGVGAYRPLFAVTAGDILVWQTKVVVRLRTAATFSCTDELVICNELSKAI